MMIASVPNHVRVNADQLVLSSALRGALLQGLLNVSVVYSWGLQQRLQLVVRQLVGEGAAEHPVAARLGGRVDDIGERHDGWVIVGPLQFEAKLGAGFDMALDL